jgi:hypothetical protein
MSAAFLVALSLKANATIAVVASVASDNRLWDKLEAIFWFVVNAVLASLLVCAPFIIIGGLVLLTLTVVLNVGEEMGKAWDRLVLLAKRQAPRLMLLVGLGMGQTAITLVSRQAISTDLRVALSFGLWSYAGALSLVSFASQSRTRVLGFRLLITFCLVPVAVVSLRARLVTDASNVVDEGLAILAGLGFVDVLLLCLLCVFMVGMFWIALHEPVPEVVELPAEGTDNGQTGLPGSEKDAPADVHLETDGAEPEETADDEGGADDKAEGTRPYEMPKMPEDAPVTDAPEARTEEKVDG